MTKVLLLHGLNSSPNSTKAQYLRSCGYEVVAPALSSDDFDGDLKIAQAAFDAAQPDVVVGSSRGGAVAVNIDSGTTPVILIAPAWKHWGTCRKLRSKCVILHSEHDDLIPLSASRELISLSELPAETLLIVGDEHRMSDDKALDALRRAIDQLTVR